MIKIVAFAGSSSKNSINRQLAAYAASLFEDAQVDLLDLNNYELPMFSVDVEKELGQPLIARAFLDKMQSADILILSLAEHNGAFSVAFKNIYDWASRQDKLVFANKPMLLLSTTPGRGGGATVLQVAQLTMPKYGANITATFSLPSFNHFFDVDNQRISSEEHDQQLRAIINTFNR